ncbi:hypothetical protein [Nocardia sp. NPDC050406]|uniref:hypothetical protein n=1 Tax=Nocardia sp. NPDC050406 TaxID=3364318 RepID=UPI0037B97258
MIERSLPRLVTTPTPVRPRPVAIALQAILIAVYCGIGETVLRAAVLLDRPHADIGDLLPALAVRAAIYLTVIALAFRMAAGAQWARWTLIAGLGTVGLASLVVEPLRAVLTTPHLSQLFVDLTTESLVLGTLRAVHLAAVLVALPALVRASPRTVRP